MDHKNMVMKSKSSNIGTASKQTFTTGNKKSWSSARFAYNNCKKRGVYVEKKSTINAESARATPGPSDVPNVMKAPKRPPRGDKTFLARCLSILSQDTTATQFPEVDALQPRAKKVVTSLPAAETVDKGTQDLDAIFSGNNSPVRTQRSQRSPPIRQQPPAPKPRRPKFRSKALSGNFNDLYVIQPKKTKSQTPDARSHSISSNRVASKSNEEALLKLDRIEMLETAALPVEDKAKENLKEEKDDKQTVRTTESRKLKKVQIEDKPLQTALYPEHSELKPTESKKFKKILRIVENNLPRDSSPVSEHDDVKSAATTESKKTRKVVRKVSIEEPNTLNNLPRDSSPASEHDDVKSSATTESKKTRKVVRKVSIEEPNTVNNVPRDSSPVSEHDDVKSSVTTESKKTRTVVRKVSTEKPNTLVSDYNSKNRSLYNLFVDLLETTFNVYNIDAEYTNPPSPTVEIEEKVAHKINRSMSLEKTNVEYLNKAAASRIYEPQRKLYNVADDGVADKVVVYQARPNCCNWNQPPVVLKGSPFRRSEYRMSPRASLQGSYGYDYRPTLKYQSLRYAQQRKIEAAAKADRPVSPKRGMPYKKYKQQHLLNILKEELQMDADYFEEPEGFHQALAKIARDKRRTRKLIHFDDDDRKADRSGKSDCFRRRKVISSSTKSPKKKPGKVTFMESLRTSALPRKYSMTVYNEGPTERRVEDEPSYHSIEVRAYDYEPNQYVRRMDLVNKALIYTSVSGVSLRSGTGFSSKDFVGDKYGNNFTRRSSSTTPSTTISQLLLRDVYNMY